MFKILLTTSTSECGKARASLPWIQMHTISRELCQRLRRLKMAVHGTLGTPPLAIRPSGALTSAWRSKHNAQENAKPFLQLHSQPCFRGLPPFFLPVQVGSTKPWSAATFPPPAMPSGQLQMPRNVLCLGSPADTMDWDSGDFPSHSCLQAPPSIVAACLKGPVLPPVSLLGVSAKHWSRHTISSSRGPSQPHLLSSLCSFLPVNAWYLQTLSVWDPQWPPLAGSELGESTILPVLHYCLSIRTLGLVTMCSRCPSSYLSFSHSDSKSWFRPKVPLVLSSMPL